MANGSQKRYDVGLRWEGRPPGIEPGGSPVYDNPLDIPDIPGVLGLTDVLTRNGGGGSPPPPPPPPSIPAPPPVVTAPPPDVLPAVVPAAATAVGIATALYQLLGGGEGEGLFGNDLLGGGGGGNGGGVIGGSNFAGGIPIGGPGLAEPSKEILLKEWHVSYDWGRLQYYLVVKPGTNRRYIMMYNTRKKSWKVWAWRKPVLAVIGKNMPSHKMLTRLRRNLKRHTDDAKTLLKLVSPGSLKTSRSRPSIGGKHRHRR
jgi:hypothetical protein